jgi:drug/metabolite transporter (DMT)-like permease
VSSQSDIYRAVARMSRAAPRLPVEALWLIVALNLLWGLNWPMLKLAVSEIPVMSFRAICVYGGAVGLFAIAIASRQSLAVPRGAWRVLALCALFNITIWHLLGAWGVSLLNSGRAAILGFTMPLWAVLFGAWMLGERITPRRLAGLVLGMVAMALLFSSAFASARSAPVGTLAMLGAALFWAVGTIIMKRWPVDMPAAAFTAWQFALGGLPMLAGALLFDLDRLHPVSFAASVGLAYTILVAFIFCHWAWVRLIALVPAGLASLSVLGVAPVGVFSGMLILGETPQWQDYAALVLVVVAIATVLWPRDGIKGMVKQ